MSKIDIYFVRHGETYFNLFHRIQGACDAHLTPRGIKDAKKAGKRLSHIKFDQAYSSDLMRAVTTAKYILKANPSKLTRPILTRAFEEENFGYFEGQDINFVVHTVGGPLGFNTYNGMISKLGFNKTAEMLKKADPYHLAEDSHDMAKRFVPGIKYIKEHAKDGDKILVAAHGSIIRCIVAHYSNLDVGKNILNGSVSKMSIINGKPRMDYYDSVKPIVK